MAAALNGLHHNMRLPTGWGRHVIVLPEFVSDGANVMGATANWYFQMEQGTYIEGAAELIETWHRLYNIIRGTINMITNAPDLLAQDLTVAQRNQVNSHLAAAYAIRALCHFTLAQFFSPAYISDANAQNQLGVVLIGDEFQNPGMPAQRATLYETFQHILADLDRAIALGNPVNRTSHYLTLNGFHAIRARVLLWMTDYEGAAEAAAEAIRLTEARTNQTGGLATTSAEILAQFHTTAPTSEDILSLFTNPLESNGVNSLFVMFNASVPSGGTGSTYGGLLSPIIRMKFDDDDVRLALYRPCQSAGQVQRPVVGGDTLAPLWWNGTDSIDFTGRFRGYVGTKYHGTGVQGVMKTPILRLPEQYLIRAEALFRTGDRAGSQDALLPIASRNPNIDAAFLTALTDEEYLQFIWDERARELALEGFRLFDLKRTQRTISRPGSAFGFRSAWTNWNVGEHVFPIPLAERNANPKIQPNANWLQVRPSP